jgi:hypothetical protein
MVNYNPLEWKRTERVKFMLNERSEDRLIRGNKQKERKVSASGDLPLPRISPA